ncbi:MAG TPA: hypothetical protein PKY97_07805, partial [Saprospiraceae bacterium]|nr:hypothetical protein [Saprospiraceae bacterium]
ARPRSQKRGHALISQTFKEICTGYWIEPKFRIRQMRNRCTTRNQWFKGIIETIRTSGRPS